MEILFVQTGFIGDVVLSTPVIEEIKRLFPDSKVSVLVNKQSASLFEGYEGIHRVISYDKRRSESGILGLFKKASQIKSYKFDIVISIHKSFRTAILLWLSKIPIRIGFSNSKFSFLYSIKVNREKYIHEVLRNLSILNGIKQIKDDRFLPEMEDLPNYEINPVGMVLHPPKVDIENFNVRSPKPLVCVAIGSVWLTKRWSLDGYKEVVREILRSGGSVSLIGGKEDEAGGLQIAEHCSDLITEDNFFNFIGRKSLIESVAIVKNSDALICNDSAPLHFASAVGTPVVAIFCATVPEFGYGPWFVPHRIVGNDNLPCRPCRRHGSNSCPTKTSACILGVKSHFVISALRSLLLENKII